MLLNSYHLVSIRRSGRRGSLDLLVVVLFVFRRPRRTVHLSLLVEREQLDGGAAPVQPCGAERPEPGIDIDTFTCARAEHDLAGLAR